MGICEVLGRPRSPWQRACVERLIGSIRRECLDHVIAFHEPSLRRILSSYIDYNHRSRTHLSLCKDSPEPRSVQPPAMGSVVTVAQVGGLHRRNERRASRQSCNQPGHALSLLRPSTSVSGLLPLHARTSPYAAQTVSRCTRARNCPRRKEVRSEKTGGSVNR
jgi:hypothetical protein